MEPTAAAAITAAPAARPEAQPGATAPGTASRPAVWTADRVALLVATAGLPAEPELDALILDALTGFDYEEECRFYHDPRRQLQYT
eukprot:tig00020801_g13946.t1